MATRGQALTLTYVAWNTADSTYETGDVANHTLRFVRDGTSDTPDNSPSEVDAVNAPGIYKITLTAAECTAYFGTLCGESSTADVVLIGVSITFESEVTLAFPDEAAGRPTTALGALRRAWEWVTNKVTRNRTTGVMTLYGADNTTELETRTQSTSSVTDQITKGA